MTRGQDILIQSLVDSGVLSSEEATRLAQAPDRPGDQSGSTAQPSDSGSSVIEKLKKTGRLSAFQVNLLEREGPQALQLGDYVLLDRLGAGGMGEVFRAVHRVMRREVAIKRLKTGSVDVPGLNERFMREVRTAAKLVHPNIVTAYDAGEDSTGCYLVMEYIPGRDLSRVIREEGALRVDRAVKYLQQAAQALAYAHKSGIIHRDIKPGNFLVDEHDTLKLLDLGLARVEQTIAEVEQSENLTLTHAHQLVGTLAYMAPEQAEDPHAASVAADLYALGATFCHMVTGRPPFVAKSAAQAIIAHRDSPPPNLGHRLPEDLDALYQSLMRKRPEDRPASADDVLASLEAIAADGALARWAEEHTEAETVAMPHGITSAPVSDTASTGSSAAQADTQEQAVEQRLQTGLRFRASLIAVTLVVCLSLTVTAIYVLVQLDADGDGETTGSPPQRTNEPKSTTTGDSSSATGPGLVPGPDAMILNSSKAGAALQETQAEDYGQRVEMTNSIGMTLRYIPSASFRRGSTEEQIEWALEQVTAEGLFDRYGEYIEGERPQQVVRIDRPYYLASTEVTVGQFRKFVEASGYKTEAQTDGIGGISFSTGVSHPDINWDNPGMEQDDRHPVINITQADGMAFCKWLSEKEGYRYDLPTENQWEYACRAGSPGRWHFGDDPSQFYAYGWCYFNSPNGTKPVAQLKPNAFGLYDMHGNAREWVLLNDGTLADRFGTGVVRGGSFTKPQVLLRSASRVGFKVRSPYAYHGFRVLRAIESDDE